MLIPITLACLPVAATCGWWAGRRHRKEQHKPGTNQIHQDYFRGLNYLINEQPDKAVDVFIKLLDVDGDTVETHLAIGNLFRRRGEVDRAIRVHQNLIARPQLDAKHKNQALSALGQDYLHAGVLDRAERIFLELVHLRQENEQSLRFLLHIYQKEKDWEKAIEIARKLEVLTKESMSSVVAQYYCELAEQMREKGRFNDAYNYLKRAQSIDACCARASLIRGKLSMESGDFKDAIRNYKRVTQQDPDFIVEITTPLAICYKKINCEDQYIKYLQECLKDFPRFSLILVISEYLKNKEDVKTAIDFVAEQIQRQPTFRGLSHLISLYLSNANGDTKEKLQILQNFMHMLMADKPLYQCVQCGFSSKSLFWLCPSCQTWNAVKPIQGLEGS